MTHPDDSEALQIGPDPDKLYLYHRQQLSAMLDGELSPDQARFMLRRLQHDVELASCWERWQVCGDVLRGQRNALLPADFAQGVAHAIAGDTEAVAVARTGGAEARPRLWRWGGGAALAASVAMAALFVAREPLQAPGSDGEPVPTRVAAQVAPEPAQPGPEPAEAAGQDLAATATGMALAGTALAVADAPRRGEERRSRAQSQRAATTRSQRRADQAPVAMAVSDAASASPSRQSLATPSRPLSTQVPLLAVTGSATNAEVVAPFTPPADAATRPWPRAVLPQSGGDAFTVGYGAQPPPSAASFHPFQPRLADPGSGGDGTPATAPPATAIGPAAVEDAPPADGTPGPR